MSNTFEFTVTVGTSNEVEEQDLAETLQWYLTHAKDKSELINYVTVQYSELDESEAERLFEMLDRFDEDQIDQAIDFTGKLDDS